MKKIHYINFGMPKSATTWVHQQLVRNPAVDYTGLKEPAFNTLYDFDLYKTYNDQFDFSLNMNTNLWSIDSDILLALSSYATHSSIIFRNPYEFIKSSINFYKPKCSNEDFINFLFESSSLDYASNSKRLKKYFPDLRILTQDQIIQDAQGTLNLLTDYLGIESTIVDTNKVNVTNYTTDVKFTDRHIAAIDKLIDQFIKQSGINVEHWKNNV